MGYYVFSYYYLYSDFSFSFSKSKTILYILHLIVQAIIKIDYIAVNNFTPQNNLLQQKQMKSGFKVLA